VRTSFWSAIEQFCSGILRITRLVAVTALPAVMVASAPVSAQQKPNIVFILADNIGNGDIGPTAVESCAARRPRASVVLPLIRVGTTSIAVHVEAWAIPRNETMQLLVTEGNFTYVAIDEAGRPRKVPT